MLVNTERDLDHWQRAWANYHVLMAMAKLGLFDLLADGTARSAETLAEELNADARAIDICGRILVRAGLLYYEDGKFQLTRTAQELIVPIGERRWEWRRRHNYADLLETVRTGKPAIVTSGGVVEEDPKDTRQFLKMLHRRSAFQVEEALKVVGRALSGVEKPRILDLGGGHGRYSAAFAAEFPGTTVTLFDREIVTQIAREISGADFALRSGDFLCDDLGGPYDLVFLAYIVSGIAIEDVRHLFKRLRAVIVPVGAIVIEDFFVGPSHLQPGAAIDFHLTLLLENERGRFRTVPELSEILADCGFRASEHLPVDGQDFGFLLAR
jgi:hypothetical protein